MFMTIKKFCKADPNMIINGVLAGLVAITAGCAYVSQWSAIIIGAVSGLIVIFATLFVDNLKIDDPFGAVAVHGFNGEFGIIAVGLFDQTQGLLTTGHFYLLGIQLLGGVVVIIWGLLGGAFIAKVCEKTVGLRASENEEEGGWICLIMAFRHIMNWRDSRICLPVYITLKKQLVYQLLPQMLMKITSNLVSFF